MLNESVNLISVENYDKGPDHYIELGFRNSICGPSIIITFP